MAGSKGWRVCNAQRTKGRGPCHGPATKGSNQCRVHGGAANKLARARKVAIEKLAEAAANYGYAIEVDPGDALQMEINRCQGIVIFLGERLKNAGAGDLVEAIGTETKVSNLENYQITRVEPIVGPWVQLFLKERQHLLALTRTALTVGLEERKLRQNTRMTAAVEAMVLQVVTDLGSDYTDPAVRKIIAKAMRDAAALYDDSAPQTGEIIPIHRKRRGA